MKIYREDGEKVRNTSPQVFYAYQKCPHVITAVYRLTNCVFNCKSTIIDTSLPMQHSIEHENLFKKSSMLLSTNMSPQVRFHNFHWILEHLSLFHQFSTRLNEKTLSFKRILYKIMLRQHVSVSIACDLFPKHLVEKKKTHISNAFSNANHLGVTTKVLSTTHVNERYNANSHLLNLGYYLVWVTRGMSTETWVLRVLEEKIETQNKTWFETSLREKLWSHIKSLWQE